ncbi:uncharacterized protein LOC131284611 [Anopheles ziemanni]|uniref:uncharacterized protein LOC131259793 n=1 Tax=Anopheles coustani TaxID=139045 RepID=UPI002658F2FC|nr:uncharacterized protein LOC131259793 [Anopheles coustani]XP_058169456.1 uncharacterized protein LOC131284611 [Anopheles ziemanni]
MAPTTGILGALVLLVVCTPMLRATENEIPETVHQLTASVNTRRLANVVGDEFVSFSTKPQDIFDGQGNPICETSFLMAQSLGRTYLKVVADSSQLHLQTTGGQSVIGGPDDAGLVQIKASAWQAFYEWANRAGVVPVFVLDYPTDGGLWDPKKALQVLSAASGLGIEECQWQLGNGNVLDGSKYGEDLKTFRTMLKAFPKQRWGVVACELKPNGAVPLEEIQYFHANIDTLVDAITISRPLYGESTWNSSSLQREAHLRGLYRQRLPLWLDLVDQRKEEPQQKIPCDDRCLKEGLEYARTLGEAARGGVSTVFKPVHRSSIQQYTLDYLTALLYKRTVGNKVFSVQQQQPDVSRTSIYAYCTRNVSGSVTLVVVNEEETDAINATIRLTTRALSSSVELFLVSVQNGLPMVNNRAFTDGSTVPELEPVTAVTTLSNGVSFYVPAQTILFATVPDVQVRECRNIHLPTLRKSVLSRDLINDPTSTDVLLQELIGALLEHAPLEPLQRRRRSAVTEKRKRFLSRFSGAAQDGDLAESLAQALSGAQPEPSPTERSVRGPRQTQAYKRQQRRVRQKEKRVEKRNLRKMKHPLRESYRERAKRGGHQLLMHRATSKHPNHRVHQRLLKRMSAKLASRKTKRSSLAEAVNEPPSFTTSDEEEQQGNRSDFPLGDVHLVISKTAGSTDGGLDYVSMDSEGSESVEYRRPDRRTPRHRPGVRRRITISQRDFHRFGLGRERMPVDSEEKVDCKYHRSVPRRKEQDMETRETKRVDRYIPIEIERVDQRQEKSAEGTTMPPGHGAEDSREGFTIAHSTNEKENDGNNEELTEGSSPNGPSEDLESDGFDEPESNRAEPEEMQLFTPAPRTSAERSIVPWLDNPPQWSLESTSAEVAEVLHRRYKRSGGQALESVESHEVERLEDFFRTNAKLQQKFAEMFDLLLEAIEELEESEENDAKEDTDDDEDETSENDTHRRIKRNALLHPQSWESRERSNMIQRQQESSESKENQIEVVRNERADPEATGTEQPPVDDQPNRPLLGSDEGKPGAYVLRSVVNFMRRATSEFHQLFSGWFKKTT